MNKEEKEAVEVLKDLSLEFEDVEKWAIVNFSKKEFESLRICVNLIEKQQKEIEELKEEQAKRSWVHIKENGEVEPLFYISKDKIRAIIEDLEKHRIMSSDDFTIKVLKGLLKE